MVKVEIGRDKLGRQEGVFTNRHGRFTMCVGAKYDLQLKSTYGNNKDMQEEKGVQVIKFSMHGDMVITIDDVSLSDYHSLEDIVSVTNVR